MGAWPRSLEYCRKALDHGQATNDLRLKVVGWWRTGSAHIMRGAVEMGRQLLRAGVGSLPAPFDATMVRAMCGYASIKAGDVEAGVAEMEKAVEWFGRSQLALHPRHLRRPSLRRLPAPWRSRAGGGAPGGVPHHLPRGRLPPRRGIGRAHSRRSRRARRSCSGDHPLRVRRRAFSRTSGHATSLARTLVAQAGLRQRAQDRAGARHLLRRALALFEECGTV